MMNKQMPAWALSALLMTGLASAHAAEALAVATEDVGLAEVVEAEAVETEAVETEAVETEAVETEAVEASAETDEAVDEDADTDTEVVNVSSVKPASDGWNQHGIASWYGPRFHGRLTASGERFNTHDLTAAHKSLPFGTRLLVRNKRNGKTVVVRINDRGPFIKGRIIDLSQAAARSIGIDGIAQVEIQRLTGRQDSVARK